MAWPDPLAPATVAEEEYPMNVALVRELYEEFNSLPIMDIHTHVNWKTGTARNIGEILSYHYYTELTNSADYDGQPLPLDNPYELMRRVYPRLAYIRNTVQYDWLMTISREFLDVGAEEWEIDDNWEAIFDRSVDVMGRPEWTEELIAQADITRVFLTNQYDEDLEGLDQSFYAPCLRTEPFVLWMDRAGDRDGLGRFLGRPVRTVADFQAAIDRTFDKFVAHGMGYAAMSIPSGFTTGFVGNEDAQRLLDRAVERGPWDTAEREAWGRFAMNRICDACRASGRPFHLMIGVTRDAYKQGVPMGQDLFDSVNSMAGYTYMLNEYPDVKFPTAVLSDTSGLELNAAAWIRHNVYPSGHWWYSNQPTDIGREIRRRIDTVPANKIIGYFSDAYYLDFILPKFRMYKFELASALAERIERSLVHPNMEAFGIDDALYLAEDMLVNNPMDIIGL
jgi:glucuronate isomerase